ncbi:unnamed protein product [Rhizophagus irregularis]|nr:unnamed protein product [Rhizophagus irregularis]
MGTLTAENFTFIPTSSNEYTCENKIIDDFIKFTHSKKYGKMEFVPYEKFKDVQFITEGGFSKIYKAIWVDGPRTWSAPPPYSSGKMTVALKELSNSSNINSKELNELMIFYNYATNNKNKKGYTYHDHFHYINKYFGITQNPTTQNFMIITKYYELGDLRNHITNDFYNISWFRKLIKLQYILNGLKNMHEANIIHRDYHSGNILVATGETPITSDLGISKSATEPLNDDDEEIYGIIPYVAPEIFQGRKYTKASDIYSFGMIMWELMTGRRPFWDKVHDSELIIEICYGLRPPIITNAPEGYIELMKECWHFEPDKRPTANNLLSKVKIMLDNETKNITKIIKSPNIGPVTTNNPGAIYKSRPLSEMIKSAASINLKSLNITLEIDKRKFGDLTEDYDENDKIIKKAKFFENNGYSTIELEFDIDNNNHCITVF